MWVEDDRRYPVTTKRRQQGIVVQGTCKDDIRLEGNDFLNVRRAESAYLCDIDRRWWIVVIRGVANNLVAQSEGEQVFSNRRLSLIHISEPTRRTPISYAVFCLKKKKKKQNK